MTPSRKKLANGIWISGLILATTGASLVFSNENYLGYFVPKYFVFVLGGCLALVGRAASPEDQSRALIPTALDKPLFVALGILILSSCFSVDPAKSILGQSKFFLHGLIPISLVIGLYFASAGRLNDSIFDKIEWCCIVTGVVLSVWGFTQITFGSRRIISGLENAAFLGGCLLPSLFCAFDIAVRETKKKKMVAAGCAVIIMIAISQTYTRAIWLGAILGGATMLMILKREVIARLGFKKLLGGCLVLLAGTIIFTKISTPGRTISDSVALRTEMWRVSWRAANKFPFLGTGPDTYYYAFKKFRASPSKHTRTWVTAHNDFFQTLATLGFPGVICYLWLCGLFLAHCIRESRSPWARPRIALSGAVVSSLFIAAKFNPLPLPALAWLSIFAAYSFTEPSRRKLIPWRKYAIWVPAMVSLGFTAIAWRLLQADRALYRGEQLAMSEDFRKAGSEFELAARYSPGESLYAIRAASNILELANRESLPDKRAEMFDRAKAEIRKILDKKKNDSDVWHMLSAIQFRNALNAKDVSELRRAHASIEKALALDPLGLALNDDRNKIASLLGRIKHQRP
ncbi:MAG: hypothetical protein COB53_02480 [Elusimicrobia bacterium]|nr:MAG: hypothetical protein COB53_02480 [Elusimicrobiota bacterium]